MEANMEAIGLESMGLTVYGIFFATRNEPTTTLSFLDPHDPRNRGGEEEGKEMARVLKVSTYLP